MWEAWNDVFRRTLGPAERSLVNELRDLRNKWAHQQTFSGDDAYHALDSVGRLLTAVSAPQSDEIEKTKMELLRLRFDEQVRNEKRKSVGTGIESAAAASLKPWREIVTPHKDVASGRYQQAEFAADLWQVHLGEGTDEYKKPVEFFRRTYLTESLKHLLIGAGLNALDFGEEVRIKAELNNRSGLGGSCKFCFYDLIRPRAEGAGLLNSYKEIGTAMPPSFLQTGLVNGIRTASKRFNCAGDSFIP